MKHFYSIFFCLTAIILSIPLKAQFTQILTTADKRDTLRVEVSAPYDLGHSRWVRVISFGLVFEGNFWNVTDKGIYVINDKECPFLGLGLANCPRLFYPFWGAYPYEIGSERPKVKYYDEKEQDTVYVFPYTDRQHSRVQFYFAKKRGILRLVYENTSYFLDENNHNWEILRKPHLPVADNSQGWLGEKKYRYIEGTISSITIDTIACYHPKVSLPFYPIFFSIYQEKDSFRRKMLTGYMQFNQDKVIFISASDFWYDTLILNDKVWIDFSQKTLNAKLPACFPLTFATDSNFYLKRCEQTAGDTIYEWENECGEGIIVLQKRGRLELHLLRRGSIQCFKLQ